MKEKIIIDLFLELLEEFKYNIEYLSGQIIVTFYDLKYLPSKYLKVKSVIEKTRAIFPIKYIDYDWNFYGHFYIELFV